MADRRFAYGEALVSAGDHEGAADLFAQTVELVPDWAPAWLALGRALVAGHHDEQAVAPLERATQLDRRGRLGAALDLSRLKGEPPPQMAPDFVAGLFDQYADRFDSHLASLAYRGPAVIVDAFTRASPVNSFGAVLDLGCGTGLMAAALGTLCKSIDGVDVSPRMVERARATGYYREIHIAELSSFLLGCSGGAYDLVVAADVFVYLGALDTLVVDIARNLRPGGLLAFTVQALEGFLDFVLRGDMRYSHSRAYVERVIKGAGLRLLCLDEKSTRRDGGIDVPGLVVVATNT